MTDAQRLLIESALVYAGGTHTVADVEALITDGRAQLWEGPRSVVVTEVDHQPQGDTLVVFLAAGKDVEIAAMHDTIAEWAKGRGCVKARFVGRKGWSRSFLRQTGWRDTGLVIMERDI